MTDAHALDAVHAALLAWAKGRLDDNEALARVTEILEGAGRPLIAEADAPANDLA